MPLSPWLEVPLAKIAEAIGLADAVGARSLPDRVRDGLDEIVFAAEPRPGWTAAAARLLARVGQVAATGPDETARLAALRAVDALADALVDVPSREEARNLGIGW